MSIRKDHKTQIVSARITKRQYKQLAKACDRHKISMSRILHIIIGDYFDAQKKR